MTPERWQQVAQLHEEALARPGAERAAFIATACGPDEELRQEVQSLLAQNEKPSFLDEPIASTAAHLLAAGNRLAIGSRVGEFRIESVLGAGGMGEVYTATDTKLGRRVALKVLPAGAAADSERVTRFRREAQVLASLNHPHIAAIHGLYEDASLAALVLELVEGPTLAERITRGRLTIEEALPISRQIALALEAAHDVGVIHRDLKPENIKVTPDGVVKVLDFGLARLATSGASDAQSEASAQRSPASGALVTRAGSVLGTAAYMSPEQAKGDTANERSDVWAFGCIVYEMLTGTRAFPGENVADTFASVVNADPDWNALPATVPASLRRLLRRCLEKDRRRRLADIADAQLEIDDAENDSEAPVTSGNTAPRTRRGLTVALACLVSAVVAGTAIWVITRPSTTTAPAVSRVSVNVTSADGLPPRPRTTALALSPDGRTLVFVGVKGDTPQLFMRTLDSPEATPIPGTAVGAGERGTPEGPFFSPDGQWIGFWIGESRLGGPIGELKKVSIAGGPAVTICKTVPLYGASWGDDGHIVYAGGEGSIGGLWRVRADGGTPERLTTLTTGLSHRLPYVLPGSRAVVFTVQNSVRRWDDAQIVVRSLVTKEQRVLVDGAADARYVSSGHLVYARGATLFARAFDPVSLTVSDSEFAMVDEVMQQVNATSTMSDTGAAQFAVSDAGTLAYLRGGIVPNRLLSLVWIDRGGVIEPLPTPPRRYLSPRLSPDGQTLAVAIGNLDRSLWMVDIRRGTMTPFGPKPRIDGFPVWMPDGKSVAFAGGSPANLFLAGVDGSMPTQLTRSDRPQFPSSWTPDGKTLAFVQRLVSPSNDIWLASFDGKVWKTRPLFETPDFEQSPEISPDGQWIAYVSDETGREEVYVRPFPGAGPRTLISTNGGAQPVWSRNGRELLYIASSSAPVPSVTMMSVEIVTQPKLSASTPRSLFTAPSMLPRTVPTRGYDVTHDARRFVMLRIDDIESDSGSQGPTSVELILNWGEEIKRRAPIVP